MRRIVLAVIVGTAAGLFGLAGLTSASAVPANGAIIDAAAKLLDMQQDVRYRRYYRTYRHRGYRGYRRYRW